MTSDEDRASKLRQAYDLIDQHCPSGGDRVALLRRLGLVIAREEPEADLRMCARCKQPFTWPQSEGEREFYETREYPPPSHCAECRVLRRAERKSVGMASYAPRDDHG